MGEPGPAERTSAALDNRMMAELPDGQWFRPPWTQHEICLVVGNECLRFGPSRYEGKTVIGGATVVTVEKPWFDVIRRRQPCRLAALGIGDWYEVDGDISVLVSRFGHSMSFGFGGVQHWLAGAQTIVIPLEVQIRVDRKPLLRRIKEWFA